MINVTLNGMKEEIADDVALRKILVECAIECGYNRYSIYINHENIRPMEVDKLDVEDGMVIEVTPWVTQYY
jgi:hypothetical protein